MDYETIVYGSDRPEEIKCQVKCDGISWDRGEILEVELPIFGGFTLQDGSFISIQDFMYGCKTKYIEMALKDSRGEIVSKQVSDHSLGNIEYHSSHISGYFIVDEELSESIFPGSYTLHVYIKNRLPADRGLKARTVFSKMITNPSGIEVTVS